MVPCVEEWRTHVAGVSGRFPPYCRGASIHDAHRSDWVARLPETYDRLRMRNRHRQTAMQRSSDATRSLSLSARLREHLRRKLHNGDREGARHSRMLTKTVPRTDQLPNNVMRCYQNVFRRFLVLVLAAVVSSASILIADDEDELRAERRSHWVLTDSFGERIGEATEIFILRTKTDRRVLLYRGLTGETFIIDEATDYVRGEIATTITDLSRESWIRSTSSLPFRAGTSDEVLRQAQAHPELWLTHDVDLLLETKGASARARLGAKETKDERWRRTSDLRRSLSFSLLEDIDRAADGLFSTAMGEYASDTIVDYLLYREPCATPVKTEKAAPDCKFDRSFGFACTDLQRSRVDEAAELNEVPEFY
jgi:hypothetical protein